MEECEEITGKIIEIFYKVYNALGYGFLEKIYHQALCLEFRRAGLEFENEYPIRVIYEGEVMGNYVADFLVDGKVVVEVKAIREIGKVDERQLLNYLRCTDKEVGLLLNFGEKAEITQ